MPVSIHPGAFQSLEQAHAALTAQGLHVSTLNVPPVHNEAHRHSFHAEFYILEGDLVLTDAEQGLEHACGAGTRVTVPAQALHAERSISGYEILLGTSIPPTEITAPEEDR